ncbi:TetR/AcrR family transcriptional regulator [Microbacterium sp. PA5]|uniref:TetR/AcrR family transcriptional regulator n=1 Tax=Microbacterium sp. PA5 TaxID=3416654 RepID=UPI003CF71D27
MSAPAEDGPAPSRRSEYAAQTRTAMVEAARKLFVRDGYADTTVEAIAREARVSPATVYAQAGGKQGLLRSLLLEWSLTGNVPSAPERWAQITDPRAKLAQLIRGTFDVYRTHGDVILIGRRAADSSADASEFVSMTSHLFRELLEEFVGQLRKTGDVAADLDDKRAADHLQFFLRFEQVRLLLADFRWSEEEAQGWLEATLAGAVLRDPGHTTSA